MENNLFDMNELNVIQDEENYYFFRTLEPGDIKDLETGIIKNKDGEYIKIRTDRERWEESHKNQKSRWIERDKISLEQLYHHIKYNYSLQTNCISLTSNANVAKMYGAQFSQRYVMVTVPKREMGEKVFSAGECVLSGIEKRVDEELQKENIPEDIIKAIEDIEDATDEQRIKEIIKSVFTSREDIHSKTPKMKSDIVYRAPTARISKYQALNEEQNLHKNKVIAKLTILEKSGIMLPIIEHTSTNTKLIASMGGAFSSEEQTYYGDIEGSKVIDIPNELIDIFSLLQQAKGIDLEKMRKLQSELIRFVKSGQSIEISEKSYLKNNYKVKTNPSIEEIYELTDGKIEYGKMSSTITELYYLAQSRVKAKELVKILRELTGNNLEYEKIYQYIEENGFEIETPITTRRSNVGYRISETVNLKMSSGNLDLVEEIKTLPTEELEEIIKAGGTSNAGNIVQNLIEKAKTNKQISKERYYAEAIIAQYNWKEIGIKEFSISGRNELIKRLQDKKCVEIYEKLKQAGIEEKKIPTILLNIVTRKGFYEQYEAGNLDELLETRQDILQDNINIELVERFLGYYDIENTGIGLKTYQQKAFNNVSKIFENNKFAQVILPTGAGKSFVALEQMIKYSEEHPGEEILYLAPQDEILNEIKKDIKEHIHGMPGTEGKSIEQIIKEVFPNTNITFETYPGLIAKRGKDIVKKQYGIIILDEIHRTGAKEWEGRINTLFENQTEDTKVLGLTATPRRDVDGRDMVEETAKKLGYTEEEVKEGKHRASNITLETAISLGYVVNPKIVYCKYDLISSGKMNELKAQIDEIEDEEKRAEELQKYNEVKAKLDKEIDSEIGQEARKRLEEEARNNLNIGIGKERILREHIKKGGKYIVFIPVTDQGDIIEDEDGNRTGKKTGADKITEYQNYLKEVFKGTDIVPKVHSLLGSYSKTKNAAELEEFESDETDETKFMVVMNKANEGIHIKGIDGIVWFRALDKNSRILYLQQLGRAIYALDKDNSLTEDKRPVIIDLANNSLTVKIEEEFKNNKVIDDLEILILVAEWINEHDGIISSGNSSNKQEQHYYSILRRIQNKYSKYLDGFDNFEDITEEDKIKINEIINLAYEIDLWDIYLPTISKTRGTDADINPFEVTGILKDFVELEEEINSIENTKSFDKNLELLKKLLKAEGEYLGLSEERVKEVQKQFKEKGFIPDRLKLQIEGEEKPNLIGRWLARQRQLLNEYREIPEKINKEEERRIKELLELGVSYTGEKTPEEIWNENLELLKKLLETKGEYLGLSEEKVKKVQKQFEEKGFIPENLKLQIEGEGKPKLIGRWLDVQRQLLNKYRETPEKTNKEEERRVKELLELGVSYTKTLEEIWNENLELLKKLLEAKGEYLGLSEERVKKVQKQFKEKGYISQSIKLQIEGEENPNSIGRWLSTQRQLLNKYRGKTPKEIEKDKGINEEEKRRVLKLLELGVSYTEEKAPEEIWNKNLKLLKELLKAEGEYLGLSVKKLKKVQKQFKEKGSIPPSVKLQIEGEEKPKKIGIWLNNQRQLLNKYRGKTPKEIKKDKGINKEEKRRVLKLLELGVSCTEEKGEKTLGEIWDENLELLKNLLKAKEEYLGLSEEKVKRVQKQFKEKGSIPQSIKLQIEGEERPKKIGIWLDNQRKLLNKYIKTPEELNKEEERRVRELLKLGVRYTKEKEQLLEDIERHKNEAKELKKELETLGIDSEDVPPMGDDR